MVKYFRERVTFTYFTLLSDENNIPIAFHQTEYCAVLDYKFQEWNMTMVKIGYQCCKLCIFPFGYSMYISLWKFSLNSIWFKRGF